MVQERCSNTTQRGEKKEKKEKEYLSATTARHFLPFAQLLALATRPRKAGKAKSGSRRVRACGFPFPISSFALACPPCRVWMVQPLSFLGRHGLLLSGHRLCAQRNHKLQLLIPVTGFPGSLTFWSVLHMATKNRRRGPRSESMLPDSARLCSTASGNRSLNGR